MPPQMRPRCQVLNCRKPCASKGRNADGEIEYRSRCEKHHRCKTPTMPVGVRQIQGICGPFSHAGKQLEAIAPVLTTEPPTPDPQPGDSAVLSLPIAERLLSQITLDDSEAEGIVLALRLRGLSQQRIAQVLGKHPSTIHRILRNARADGKLNDVLMDLTHQALPLAVERLLEQLDEGEPWAIKETIKGLGAFRTYRQQDTHRESDDTRTLHVTFETPERPVILNAQNIVGTPRRLTKGVVDAVSVTTSIEQNSTGQDPESREGETATDDPLAACVAR